MVEKIVTKSENTVAAYEFLEANKDKAFQIVDIAKGTGLTPAKVTSGVVSLSKKGILIRREEEVEGEKGTKKTFQWAKPAVFVFETAKKMSDKGVQLLQYLQRRDGEDFTAAEAAEDLGVAPIAVNAVLNSLVKRELAFREEALVEMPDGSEKVIKFAKLTDKGRSYEF